MTENDLISRQAAIEIIQSMYPGMTRLPWLRKDWEERYEPYIRTENAIRELPSARPEISRIEQELHGKTPEEQYEFIYWLLLKFARAYTDSRLAVVEWLRGEKEDED